MPTVFDDGKTRADVGAARRVSIYTVVWTVCASSAFIALGISGSSLALVAVGAIGFLDAIGSLVLAYHFHHAIQHEAISDRLESIAHKVVVIGMGVVGVSAITLSSVKIISRTAAEPRAPGALLAAASVVVLSALAYRKTRLAVAIGSHGLRADGRLSAIGAGQAFIALAGVGLALWLNLSWADAAAALALGGLTVVVAFKSWANSQ